MLYTYIYRDMWYLSVIPAQKGRDEQNICLAKICAFLS